MKRIKLFAVCFLATMAVAFFITGVCVKPQAAAEDGVWTGFNVNTENGAAVYTSPSVNVQTLAYSADVGENDYVEFSMRANSTWNGEPEANLTFWVDSADEKIGFKIMNYWKAVRIISLDGSDNESYIRDAENYADNLGGNWNNKSYKWYDFRLVFSSAAFEVYADGQLIMSAGNLGRFDFKNAACRFTSWGCTPSVKNVVFGKSLQMTSDWFGDCEKVEEDGETVYNVVGELAGDAKKMYCNATTADANVIRFSFRPNADRWRDDTIHTTFYIALSSQKYLGFRFMNYWKASRIVLIDGDTFGILAESKYVPTSDFTEGWNGYDKWYDACIYFTDEYIMIYVDGYASSFIHYRHGYDIHDKPVFIGNWGHCSSLKNISVTKEEYNAFELGYSDFEFRTRQSLDALNARNAAVSFDDGCAVMDISGDEPKLTLNVNQKEHGSYSADLWVRNSVLLRLKNLSGATRMTLDARSDQSDAVYSKKIELINDGQFHSYLVNFSDLSPKGYLTQLDLTPEGVSSGRILIDAVSFEREERLKEYVGENVSCTADKKNMTVTVSGRLLSFREYYVRIYTTPVTNYTESVLFNGVRQIASAPCDENGDFSVTFPLIEENGHNHLNSLFLAAAGNMNLSKAFSIENYRDFLSDPYEFDVPALSVKVTDSPFNAVGDSYTDDTDAIQAAIDYVYSAGGGKVIVPGSDDVYGGKRYMITHIRIKDNVELHLEKNATLWQSPRVEDYKYDVIFGHDYISDSMWPHACNVNYPLILMKDAHNVKLTGKGTVRLADWGDRAEDSLSVTDPKRGQNCANIIHVAPVYAINCHGVELSDFTVIHTNNWHITTRYCSEMAIVGLTLKEASCANSDGLGLSVANNVYVARNFLYSNDDAITLTPTPEDPRKFSWWNTSDYQGPKTVSNVEIEYNNMFGGLGLVFIPWGSASPDLENVATRNIVVHDNMIGGHQRIGSWPDNPFYGTSAFNTYNFNEKNDSSPIYDVYMYNNDYYGDYADLSWERVPQVKACATTFINDASYRCSSGFINGSFERTLRFDEETNFTSGLSNWTFAANNGSATTTVRGVKETTAETTGNAFTVTDYAARISGGGQLYQGLYLTEGVYRFIAEYSSDGGTTQIFVGTVDPRYHVSDPFGATVVISSTLDNATDYKTAEIVFRIEREGVYALGFIHDGNGTTCFDDCSVSSDEASADVLAAADTALNSANAIDLSLYTQESVFALTSASAELRAAINAYALDISDVSAKTQALNAAVSALEEKPSHPEPDHSGDSSSSSGETSAHQSAGTDSSSVEEQSAITEQSTDARQSAETERSQSVTTVSSSEKPSDGCGGNVPLLPLISVALAPLLLLKKKNKKTDE